MSAAIIGLGGIQVDKRLRNGTPVRLRDGREGWVHGFALVREATSDDPGAIEVVTRIDHYTVRLTCGRGNVAVDPRDLQVLRRNPLPANTTSFPPKGAA